MQFLWNRATFCIFLGVVIQSFCSIKLVWLNQLLGSISGERFSLNGGAVFVCAWAAVTFFSRITGAYTLGKYAEAKGFFATQKVLVLGYILTTFLFFLCCSYASYTYQIRWVMLLVVYFNVFLYPATLVLPAMYLMKLYNTKSHVKISMLTFLAFVLGYVLSCAVSIEYTPQAMSGIICIGSFLCGFLYYMGKNSILSLEKSRAEETKKYSQILPGYKAKFLALLIGGVCGAGMRHNYFFTEPYLLNVSIVNFNGFKFGYLYFYVTLGGFLILASKICKYVNSSRLMFRSLIGILLLSIILSIFGVSSGYAYYIYQAVFAFFFPGFLAPSLALVFSLFRNGQPFLNGMVWYYFGISFSYLAGYFLSKQLGIFHHYFLLVSPLVFFGVLCMIAMAIEFQMIRSSSKK